MKELIPKNELGIFADRKDIIRVDSLFVAEFFEKRHDHVIRDIRKITDPKSGLSEYFINTNFKSGYYKDTTGRRLPCYFMTRDGFTMLVMGYTGKKAMKFKEEYIKAFNEMEEQLETLIETRHEFPELTEQIKFVKENPRPYHFSNEADMINRVAIGMSAKEFRIRNGLDKKESIRPHLQENEIKLLRYLQKIDAGLLIAVPDYQQRKRHLEWCKLKIDEGAISI